MKEYITRTFPNFISKSLRNFADRVSLSFVDEKPFTYSDLENEICSLIAFLDSIGIEKGDKVAILSANMPNWAVVYFAVTFKGAVAVPLLPDFHKEELKGILEHSGSKMIFVSQQLLHKVKDFSGEYLQAKVLINDFSVIESLIEGVSFSKSVKGNINYSINEDDIATIIYTSGTTGNPKGVMLSHKNIISNAIASGKVQEINERDRFLSVLPLSHTYENTIGLILPLLSGASVYYLKQPPTATVLLPAVKKVKPTVMLTVPLIIEKIYRGNILPKFQKNVLIKALYFVPVIRKLLNKIAGKKLYETFGGHLKFFGIGGAKLDKKVERFLLEAKFPYAIGYGLTETAPLIAGVNPQNVKWQSTGPVVDGMQMKINNPDSSGIGEIWAKGPCVMAGYYKDEAQTKKVLTEDGWFKTGDLGKLNKEGFLFIKGRIKNMILGSSGENIFPEEIESVINNFRCVVESLVVHKKGKLVALVHFNIDEIEKQYQYLKHEFADFVEQKIEELKLELYDYVNTRVSKFSRIQLVEVQATPFQKTATQKIKRYLYL